jgi:hypothetical protein
MIVLGHIFTKAVTCLSVYRRKAKRPLARITRSQSHFSILLMKVALLIVISATGDHGLLNGLDESPNKAYNDYSTKKMLHSANLMKWTVSIT